MTLFLNTTLFSDFSSLLDIFIYLNSLINLIIEGGYYLCISLLVTGSLYYINYIKAILNINLKRNLISKSLVIKINLDIILIKV